MAQRPVVLVVGGGYVGLYTALRLQKRLSRGRAEVVVVDPQPHMTYQPFLPEAAAGSVEPRHVVVPLRRTLPRCRVVTGAVTDLSHADKRARIAPLVGEPYELSYDVLVMAAGSVARTLPIPGLAEHGIGFKNVGEAIYLRNHVLARLEAISDGCVVKLSDGDEFPSDTLVWTAGTKPNPMLTQTDLPVDERGRVVCEPTLQVRGVPDAWSAGDLAAVPDLTKESPGATTAPNAQHAVRQAKRLADNIVATLEGREPEPYQHAYAGPVASLGLHKGVAQVYGVKLKGWPAWFMHRTYHVSRVPTFNRKARVVADWTLAAVFRREVISLGQLQDPRREFVQAANTGRTGSLPPPSAEDKAQSGSLRARAVAWGAAGAMAWRVTAALDGPAVAAPGGATACEKRTNDTVAKLTDCVTLDGVMEHMEAFQAIADAPENAGTRASGTPGFTASADYVQERLERAGWE